MNIQMLDSPLPTMNQGEPLPVPDSGLPEGWTIEQWNAYGYAWIKQQELETESDPVSIEAKIEPDPYSQMNFEQPTVMINTPQHNSNSNGLSTIAIVSVCAVVLIVGLAVLLYAWANSLVSDEIEGTWYNPSDTLTLNSDGSVVETTGTLEEWRVQGNRLYFVSSELDEGYEYLFHYEISDNSNVLFLAPYDENDPNTISSRDCIAYTRNSAGMDWDDFEQQIDAVPLPEWCDVRD